MPTVLDRMMTSDLQDEALLILGFLLLLLVTLGLLWGTAGDERKRRRLDTLLSGRLGTGRESGKTRRQLENTLSYLIFLIPGQGKEREAAEEKLRHAGFRSPYALTIYYLLRLFAILVLPGCVYLFSRISGTVSETNLIFYPLGAFVAGLFLSSHLLDRLVKKRQGTLRNALPDALDLLVVCSEAGLGLNSALIRLVREIGQLHPDLASEFSKVNSEIQGGMDREAALNNMIYRTGLGELTALVRVINQTMKLGTSIAETLRIYSDEWRDQRMQAAEERAAEVSTKMIFPLVLCFLPCFFIVAIGPSGIKMMAVLH